MLLAFVAIIGMIDYLLKFTGTSFEAISGDIFSPVAYIMGVPYEDCFEVGRLLGVKVAFNEFLSFQKLQLLIESGALSQRAVVIATYALCSFANFGSIAILLGSVNVLAPERKREAAKMSLRALVAGCMAGFMTSTIAGILI
jgi:CNT family concentrative nucleoside transporter